MTTNILRLLTSFLIITSLCSCNKELVKQMSHNHIKKAHHYKDKYHFDSFNTPSSYALNLDSINAMKKRGISFCNLIERDLGYIQTFYTSQFDFDTDFPLEKKSSFCGFDTCKTINCGYSITYYSNCFTIDKQAMEAKPLPKQLFMSDNYYNTLSYYGLMLRLDISVVTTTVNGISTSELDISTEIIWRQRSKDDTEGWETMNRSKQINDEQYVKFKSNYQNLLTSYLDVILKDKGYLIKTKAK